MQTLLLLKNNFSIKSSVFVEVPLNVPCRSRVLRPLADLQATYTGRRVPDGLLIIAVLIAMERGIGKRKFKL